jgi:hypothetical protein
LGHRPNSPDRLQSLRGNDWPREPILGAKSIVGRGTPIMCDKLEHLAHAFERATGRPAKVTLDSRGKYGGHFLELVETVLPLTRDIAQQFGWPMSHSRSTSARGKFVYEHTRAGKSFPQISYAISDVGA